MDLGLELRPPTPTPSESLFPTIMMLHPPRVPRRHRQIALCTRRGAAQTRSAWPTKPMVTFIAMGPMRSVYGVRTVAQQTQIATSTLRPARSIPTVTRQRATATICLQAGGRRPACAPRRSCYYSFSSSPGPLKQYTEDTEATIASVSGLKLNLSKIIAILL